MARSITGQGARFLLLPLLSGHVVLSLACFFTMSMDLDRGTWRRFFDHAIDFYEAVGFGHLWLGILLIGLALVAALLVFRRRGSGKRKPGRTG